MHQSTASYIQLRSKTYDVDQSSVLVSNTVRPLLLLILWIDLDCSVDGWLGCWKCLTIAKSQAHICGGWIKWFRLVGFLRSFSTILSGYFQTGEIQEETVCEDYTVAQINYNNLCFYWRRRRFAVIGHMYGFHVYMILYIYSIYIYTVCIYNKLPIYCNLCCLFFS